ncbi:MAG TPA: type II toxin-antitoxin system PemK/MazF family toxin [Humibacillus sp.]|nr:type II toxin-antitoxin system PemK/MazF family toxin [Humibacillus sp.]
MSAFDRLVRGLRSVLRGPGSPSTRGSKPGRDGRAEAPDRPMSVPTSGGDRTAYPGDATTLPDTTYAPAPDGNPDPGEIVWTWVPYEEDHSQGKDRPVLVIGREADWLVALPLTSKDHDGDARQERSSGREWVDIGTGDWDRRGRPSEVRVNRLVRVDPAGVRREGAVLPRDRYERVVAAARAQRG